MALNRVVKRSKNEIPRGLKPARNDKNKKDYLPVEVSGSALEHLAKEDNLALIRRCQIEELDAVVVTIPGSIADYASNSADTAVEGDCQLNSHLFADFKFDAGVNSQPPLVQLGSARIHRFRAFAVAADKPDRHIEVMAHPTALRGQFPG